MISSKRKIGFFYPSTQLGGAELLLVRYFNFLLEYKIDVYFFVRTVDEIYYSLINETSRIVPLEDFKKERDNSDWVIIIPAPLCFQKDVLLNFMNANLICWLLHPGLIIGFLNNKKVLNYISKNIIRSIICKIGKNYSLWFLDSSCYYSTKDGLNLKMEPIYMPLLVEVYEDYEPKYNTDKKISIAFVQRMVKNKLVQVDFLLEQLVKFYPEKCKSIDIHFIGDGPDKFILKDYRNYFSSFAFHGTLQNRELYSFLNDYIDITIGMGQSILDAAISGNLSIMIDLVNGDFEENEFKFSFIFENENLSLGDFYKKENYQFKRHGIEDLICLIDSPASLYDLKLASQEYVFKTYLKSDEKLERLVSLIEKANYRLNPDNILMLSNITVRSFFINLFNRKWLF